MPDSRRDLSRMLFWLGIAVLVAGLDQLTKHAMLAWLEEGQRVTVTGFFDFILVYNEGAAFSFLADHSGWQRWFFVCATVLICAWLLWLLWQSRRQYLMPTAFSLIIGGALGNLIDRLVHGKVVDFLLFHIDRYAWPAFNLADSAITVGVVLVLLDMFRHRSSTEKTQ